MSLSPDELSYYQRHITLSEIGKVGQEKLKSSSILCIGSGGLGSPAILYLAAAGFGRIGIVDFDVVDTSNLHRQIIHSTAFVDKPKVESAKKRILELNPFCDVTLYNTEINRTNAFELIEPYDIVLDGSDNFKTRYLVNDACVLLGKPNVFGSIFKFEGQITVFTGTDAACYRCVFPEPPEPESVPSCAEIGVLGVLPGVVGSIQATEAIKLALGIGQTLKNRILRYNALEMRFAEYQISKHSECPICGENPTIHELIDYESFCSVPSVHLLPENEIDVYELQNKIERNEPFRLIDIREPFELDICQLPNAQHIPMKQFLSDLNSLPKDEAYVVICRSGLRSETVVHAMKDHGITNVFNLEGGILEWAKKIDRQMRRY